MQQVWHPYTLWEEYHYGMWRQPPASEMALLLPVAVKFTGDHKLYGKWMMKVLKAWPISTEHNLTNISINRKAWVGHAGCCLATGIPEVVTRKAWGELSQLQQDKANDMARKAIAHFEEGYNAGSRQYGLSFFYGPKNQGMDNGLGTKRVSTWNP
jgi:hypothetical protein